MKRVKCKMYALTASVVALRPFAETIRCMIEIWPVDGQHDTNGVRRRIYDCNMLPVVSGQGVRHGAKHPYKILGSHA
jgi:hypothetical protein